MQKKVFGATARLPIFWRDSKKNIFLLLLILFVKQLTSYGLSLGALIVFYHIINLLDAELKNSCQFSMAFPWGPQKSQNA